MQAHIERFIRFLAAEKGLSVAYQISVRQTLENFPGFWGKGMRILPGWIQAVWQNFLRHLQSRGMARSSMRVEMVHLRIFFRWLAGTGILEKDPFRIHGNAAAGSDTASCAGSAYRLETS